jgi:heme-degrading monooxygenase HmoA
MIVRILSARIPSPHVGEFNQLLRGKLDVLHQQPGLVYAKLARRLNDAGDEEVVLFEEWATPADLWEWTGGHLTEPRFLPGMDKMIEELSIGHYEALDVSFVGSPGPITSQQVVLRGTPVDSGAASKEGPPAAH